MISATFVWQAPTRLTIHTIPDGVPPEPQGHTSTSQNGVEPLVQSFTYPVRQPAGCTRPPAPDLGCCLPLDLVPPDAAANTC